MTTGVNVFGDMTTRQGFYSGVAVANTTARIPNRCSQTHRDKGCSCFEWGQPGPVHVRIVYENFVSKAFTCLHQHFIMVYYRYTLHGNYSYSHSFSMFLSTFKMSA